MKKYFFISFTVCLGLFSYLKFYGETKAENPTNSTTSEQVVDSRPSLALSSDVAGEVEITEAPDFFETNFPLKKILQFCAHLL